MVSTGRLPKWLVSAGSLGNDEAIKRMKSCRGPFMRVRHSLAHVWFGNATQSVGENRVFPPSSKQNFRHDKGPKPKPQAWAGRLNSPLHPLSSYPTRASTPRLLGFPGRHIPYTHTGVQCHWHRYSPGTVVHRGPIRLVKDISASGDDILLSQPPLRTTTLFAWMARCGLHLSRWDGTRLQVGHLRMPTRRIRLGYLRRATSSCLRSPPVRCGELLRRKHLSP